MFDSQDYYFRHRGEAEAIRGNKKLACRLSQSCGDLVYLIRRDGGLAIEFKSPARGSIVAAYAAGREVRLAPAAKVEAA